MAARVFVGAKVSSNLPPRAQHCIWAGQSQRWRAYDATPFIGTGEKNLSRFNPSFMLGRQVDRAQGGVKLHIDTLSKLRSAPGPEQGIPRPESLRRV